MQTFTIPEDGSVAWQWAGKWYLMTYADSRRLDSLYNGGHPHGPTHEEKIAIMHRCQWDTCEPRSGIIHCRSPRTR